MLVACLLAACGRLGFDTHIVEVSDGDAGLPGDLGPNPADERDAATSSPGDGDGPFMVDAGPDDAAVPDALEGGSFVLACSGPVCSGFEGAADETPFTPRTELFSTVGTSGEQVHSGAASLRAATTTSNRRATAEFALPARTTGDLYARAWFFVPFGALTGRVNALYLGNISTAGGVDLNLNGDGTLDLYFTESAGARVTSRTGVVPQTRWFCVQLHVSLSDSVGSAQASVDGAEVVATSAAVDTLPTGGVRSLLTGINWTENGQATSLLFVDDVALDTAPVPCD